MAAEKKSDWKRWAAEAIEEGYLPGNRWEAWRMKYLRENQPELVKELEADGDLKEMVQVQTWRAMKLQESLEDEGTPPETAQELALANLFPERN
jgi:hypothetical protein